VFSIPYILYEAAGVSRKSVLLNTVLTRDIPRRTYGSLCPRTTVIGIGINLAGMSANHSLSIVSLSCLFLLRHSAKLNQLRTSLVIL